MSQEYLVQKLDKIKNEFIVFGDSHGGCFSSYVNNVKVFHGSSAKGLGNPISISGTNNNITQQCMQQKYNGYIFLFGKVDMDFVLTYILHTRPQTNFKKYIDNILYNYINFIKELCVENVYICELAISHLTDENLVKINNSFSPYQFYIHIDGANNPITYHTCLPYNVRNEHILYFNEKLKEYCKENNYKLLEVNKYFLSDSGEYNIPIKYINENETDHHLKYDQLGELYIKSIEI